MIKMLVGQVRYKKNLTLLQLSMRSGVSISAINYIEGEQCMPTIKTLCALARALKVPVTDLFFDTEAEN